MYRAFSFLCIKTAQLKIEKPAQTTLRFSPVRYHSARRSTLLYSALRIRKILGRIYKTFYSCNLWKFAISWSVFPWRELQPSLMFMDKAGGYHISLMGLISLREVPFRAPLCGRLLALSTNIWQGYEGLPRTNSLAYYKHSDITAVIFLEHGTLESIHYGFIIYKKIDRFRSSLYIFFSQSRTHWLVKTH